MDATWPGATSRWTLGDSLGKQNRGPPDMLASGGFQSFYDDTRDQHSPGTRKHYDSAYTAKCLPLAEPALTVGISTPYYSRRQGNADGYRPHIKPIKQFIPADKPDRKRYLTGVQDPVGTSHVTGGIKAIQINTDPGHMDLPPMPKMNRDAGMHATVQREDELLLERQVNRKIKSTKDGYYGTGRAGDMSVTYSCAERIEDNPALYKTPKDTLTFTRFVNSCAPSPGISHADRRRLWYEEKANAEKQAEREMVKSLDEWDPTAPPKRLDVPDPDEEDPEDAAAAAAAAAKKPAKSKSKKK
mmetsp:Transcript_11848/g.30338  ORF Transcript_11848/g.30338 Transcript_11848/m.30338 type:complete len:300 (-) Transcript_11848:2788-3687(-)